jgi:hypothetical protein
MSNSKNGFRVLAIRYNDKNVKSLRFRVETTGSAKTPHEPRVRPQVAGAAFSAPVLVWSLWGCLVADTGRLATGAPATEQCFSWRAKRPPRLVASRAVAWQSVAGEPNIPCGGRNFLAHGRTHSSSERARHALSLLRHGLYVQRREVVVSR